jgi:hypothetical protein
LCHVSHLIIFCASVFLKKAIFQHEVLLGS